MRESNFNLPAQNRACVCISQALYDRRAIDAPAPSLPLVNSLTHLSYLTATSPRIREILSIDGGLERLVRILKACASNSSGGAIEENLSQLKGKGTTLAKGARKSPFKSFAEYTPTIDDFVGSSSSSSDPSIPRPLPLALPSPSPTSSKAKQLLFTYTLAFQCVVNIGVRGSETIRTRVVEAGALDVVVNVLERYLEEAARRKKKVEGGKKVVLAVAPSSAETEAGGPRVEVMLSLPLTQPSLARLEATASSSSTRTVSASSSSTSLLAPPARVSTPDTVASSMDEAENDGDNGSSSGQEGDEVVVMIEVEGSERRVRNESKAMVDRDGDVVMDGEGSSSAPPTDVDETAPPPAPATARQRSNSRRHHHAPQPTPPPPAPTPAPTTEEGGGLQYRDEDVLLSLQLLAYLSKYPHVRSVFHSPAELLDDAEDDCSHSHSHSHSHSRSHGNKSSAPSTSTTAESKHPTPTLSSNVFSLVESFTHRPPTSDSSTPRHSNEVQYWAGVIMRNACRKDESRGGIRQCANMQCGVWEKYAREFAKCRRCRKAKYCSKGCQSSAWGRGHRYWCAKAAPKEGGVGVEGGEGAERRRGGEEEDEEEEVLRSTTGINTNTATSTLHLPLDGTHTPTDPPPHPRLRGLTPHRANAGIPPLHVPGAGMNVPGGPRINVEGFGEVDLLGGGGGGLGGLDEMAAAREMMGGGVVFGVGEEGV